MQFYSYKLISPKEEDCIGLIEETIKNYNRIDVLVNNAGGTAGRSTRRNYSGFMAKNLGGGFLQVLSYVVEKL